MEPLYTALIIAGAVAVAAAVIVLVIRAKLRSAAAKYLGTDLKGAADMISKGLQDETELPKPISNVSEMYRPKLERDFPHMTYERFISLAEAALLSILRAISSGSTDELTDVTDALREKIRSVIESNARKGVTEHFDDVTLHRTAVADYRSADDKAVAVFEISFACVHFTEGSKKRKAAAAPAQFAASVTLCYGGEFAERSSSLTRSHNCPNCGAPVYAIAGRMLQCRYCGTGITEDIHGSWLADSYKIVK